MFEVYATRFDDRHIVEELIPAKGLEFSLPVSDHGEASFTATVEPGRSFWRPALALPVSGILIAKDGVPVWQGWVTDERPSGPRSFSFSCKEWGAFFEDKVPAKARSWSDVNDHQIFRDIVNDAQSVAGQDLQVVMGSTMGAQSSDKTINPWDDTTAGREFRAVGDAAGGPEWYFGTAGTLDNPVRQLVLGDRLGQASPEAVLEFVEETEDYRTPEAPPMVTLLGGLFPGPAPMVPTRRAGGNVIAQARTKSVGSAATVFRASGAGEELARMTATATSTRLLNARWPRMTAMSSFSDEASQATLSRLAAAGLAARAGIATGYSFVTLDGDPTADWMQTPRGSTVRAIIDTDVYGAERPVGGRDGFDARCYDMVVRVPDQGSAQVEWRVADVLEV